MVTCHRFICTCKRRSTKVISDEHFRGEELYKNFYGNTRSLKRAPVVIHVHVWTKLNELGEEIPLPGLFFLAHNYHSLHHTIVAICAATAILFVQSEVQLNIYPPLTLTWMNQSKWCLESWISIILYNGPVVRSNAGYTCSSLLI